MLEVASLAFAINLLLLIHLARLVMSAAAKNKRAAMALAEAEKLRDTERRESLTASDNDGMDLRLHLRSDEADVLCMLAATQDMTPGAVMRQALRTYQASRSSSGLGRTWPMLSPDLVTDSNTG